MYAIPFRNVVITPAAVAIVTAQGLVDALKQTPADVALLVPSVVAELAQSPELLEYCAENLEMIGYIGGDLPQQIGDQVAAVMPLRCQWGASEVGMPPQPIAPQLDPQRDWKYVGFHHSTGIVMEKVGEDLYELVVKREKELVDTQPTFTIAGKESLDEYRTCDLFSPHPTIPNEWAWKARADDIIVFLNGEKTNPITMEQHIVSANPTLLSGAIVIGAQRFQPALLLEPITEVKTTTEQAAFIEKVWPTIEEANRIAPAHARVDKSLVLLTEPARPLVRAGKGTLQRGVSISKYESEINTMYENLEAENTSDLVDGDQEATGIEASLAGEDVVARHIHSSVLEATGWSTLDDHRSFFDLGMDSLQALKLLRTLRRAFRLPTLGLSTIYQNSTVTNLAKAIVQGQEADTGNNDESERKAMSSLLKTYREIIHDITVPTEEKIRLDTQEPIDVILTGSTGTLGSMLLQSLLNRKSVGHIFCLNRRPMAKRQHNETDPGTERITFLQVDLSKPHLGLDDPVYKMLQDRVGLIIHSAWPVNFNLALSAFRPQLAGMVNLFSFAAGASRQPRLLFVSSVGAVSGASGKAATPEAVIESLDVAHTNGYSRSKLISELLCDDAAKHLKLPVSIVRVGQVAGPSTPAGQETSSWSRAEWLPSLVISSMHMGCIPEDLGPRFSKIDWIPSDLMANVIVDLATTESTPSDSSNSQVFNLRNPRTTTWQVLIPTIQSIAKERVGSDLEVVSSSTWLERLEHSARRDSGYAEDDTTLSVKLNPAIRLLDFYRHGLWGEGPAAEPMSVQCALSSSSQLRDMPAVQEDWMRQWAQSWLM
jgi:thioester reductase-like protein/aryl carrier-like protein